MTFLNFMIETITIKAFNTDIDWSKNDKFEFLYQIGKNSYHKRAYVLTNNKFLYLVGILIILLENHLNSKIIFG